MLSTAQKLVAFIVVLSAIKLFVAHAAETEYDVVFTYPNSNFETEIPGKRVFYRTGVTMKEWDNKKHTETVETDKKGFWRVIARKPHRNSEKRTLSADPKFTFKLNEWAWVKFNRETDGKQCTCRAKIIKIEQGVAKCERRSGKVVIANQLFKNQCQSIYDHEPSTMKKGDDCLIERNGKWEKVTFQKRDEKQYKFSRKRSFIWDETIYIPNKMVGKRVRFPKQCDCEGWLAYGNDNPKGSNTTYHKNVTKNLLCEKCFLRTYKRPMNQPLEKPNDGRKSAAQFAQSGESAKSSAKKSDDHDVVNTKAVSTRIAKDFIERMRRARENRHEEDVLCRKVADRLLKGMKRRQQRRNASGEAKVRRRTARNIKQEELGEYDSSSSEYMLSDCESQVSSDTSSRMTVDSVEAIDRD